MKYLHCGHCCISYEVIIIDNPDLPLSESNILAKAGGVRCKHLLGDASGRYKCGVHNHPDYEQTPCYDFGQVEESGTDDCRVGNFIMLKSI